MCSLGHLASVLYLNILQNQSWKKKYEKMKRNPCHFGPCFALLSHFKTTKIKLLKKWKKKKQQKKNNKNKNKPTDIILHRCTINNNHIMYDSWYMEGKGQNFFVIFCQLFVILKTQNFEKTKKNAWRYHFTQLSQKLWSYATLFLRYFSFYFISFYSSFWTIFCPFTPLKTKQFIFLKNKKKHLEISSFYMCTKNYNQKV